MTSVYNSILKMAESLCSMFTGSRDVKDPKEQNNSSAQDQGQTTIMVEVSVGELVDKFSVLEIKSNRIDDQERRYHINMEMQALDKHVFNLVREGSPVYLEYRLLKFVNENIWNIKERPDAYDYTCVMAENIARFRLRTRINNKTSSKIKEQKSHHATSCYLGWTSELSIADAIMYARYKSLYFDRVYLIFPKEFEVIINREKHMDDKNIHITCTDDFLFEQIEMSCVPAAFIEIMRKA